MPPLFNLIIYFKFPIIPIISCLATLLFSFNLSSFFIHFPTVFMHFLDNLFISPFIPTSTCTRYFNFIFSFFSLFSKIFYLNVAVSLLACYSCFCSASPSFPSFPKISIYFIILATRWAPVGTETFCISFYFLNSIRLLKRGILF